MRILIPMLLVTVLVAGCGGDDRTGGVTRTLVGALEKGAAERTRGDMQAIAVALNQRLVDAGGYPQFLDIGELASILEAGYIGRMPTTDGWNNPLTYQSDGSEFSITSHGADEAPGGGDDIVLTDGGFR